MDNSSNYAGGHTRSVTLKRSKECKGSVRFETDQDYSAEVPVTNVYVGRLFPGLATAKAVKVTVEVVQ